MPRHFLGFLFLFFVFIYYLLFIFWGGGVGCFFIVPLIKCYLIIYSVFCYIYFFLKLEKINLDNSNLIYSA